MLVPWCFVALVLSRGHRSPYAFLLPALILSFVGNAINIALEVLLNMPTWYVLPIQVQLALNAVQSIFLDWADTLLILSIIAVLWNRENAISVAIGGKVNRHNHIFTAIYAFLVVLLFALGTTAPAIFTDALRRYTISQSEIDYYYNPNAPLEQQALDDWYIQRLNVWNNVNYTYNGLIVLTDVVIVISTILLWRKGRAAGIKDKVTFLIASFSNQFLHAESILDYRYYALRCHPSLRNLQYIHFHFHHRVLKSRTASQQQSNYVRSCRSRRQHSIDSVLLRNCRCPTGFIRESSKLEPRRRQNPTKYVFRFYLI